MNRKHGQERQREERVQVQTFPFFTEKKSLGEQKVVIDLGLRWISWIKLLLLVYLRAHYVSASPVCQDHFKLLSEELCEY